ncbi:TBC1 domain family member 30-like [Xenia sp. Carnegie-2017]|uniref:TBC1 domain family member 30-like n=1 Tax=Xenia sp. Carnegie-2017 TaxID=2897299 RepID=UPI001F044784|nr:TBC1 domain family member 30-like [Xenia sp. Carnegie-2017]
MDDLAVDGGRQQIAYRSRSPSLGEIDSIFSDESSSPNSVDSECSFETTESSLDEELQASGERTVSRQSSIVDGLLNEIYDRYHHGSRSGDSDNVTEYSTTSFYSGSFELDERTQRWSRTQLNNKDVGEIRRVLDELNSYVTLLSGRLVRHLKRRDKNAYRLQRNFDVLTAILQAVSLKRRVDTKIKFSFIPQSGKKGFRQWLDSFKAVSRLPRGVPSSWRRRLWLILAENKLSHLDWKKTSQFCFNERSNPDDDNLGAQIVKDLHRTGCSWFCEFETPDERAILKRVLLAYARWNKGVGYCQGFNVMAALILQVMDRCEEDALKVMVYLIDFVLPANYFSNNLRSLSIDMAVLRELMTIKLPDLSDHLHYLQRQATAQDNLASISFEPPLTNVFTMQWFLTMFATCLPEQLVLRVWDCILLEGSEVLLRVALAIWATIGLQLEDLESADEFYGAMGRILPQIQDGTIISDTSLMSIYVRTYTVLLIRVGIG